MTQHQFHQGDYHSSSTNEAAVSIPPRRLLALGLGQLCLLQYNSQIQEI